MKILLSVATICLLLTSINAKNTDSIAEFSYKEVLQQELDNNLKTLSINRGEARESVISNKNKLIKKYEEKQRVKFVLKDYKKIDIYVRNNYTVIDNNYVLKNPAGWRRVLIKETNVWE